MRYFFRIHAALLALAMLWSGSGTDPVLAQQRVTLVEPPPPLLPATLGKLTRVAEGDSGDGLGKLNTAGLTAQDQSALAEDGLKRFATSDYDAAGQPRGTVTVFSFRDVSGAISAYDYFRHDGMRQEKLADAAVSKGDELLLRSGANVVTITHSKLDRDKTQALVGDLAVHLPKPLGTAGIPPLLPSLLPEKGLDPDSVKYALGPVAYAAMGGILPPDTVGFDKSGEAVTARYRNGGTLTLMLYPTPEIAGERGRAARAALGEKAVTLRRDGPLVAVATGPWSTSAAQKLVDGIHLRTEISFDKPMPLDFHVEVQKTYTLLQSVALFCGVGAVAAIVLGLFFGGGRALIRVMQGKPAAVEPEFLHIDLRGSPHRIVDEDATPGPEV